MAVAEPGTLPDHTYSAKFSGQKSSLWHSDDGLWSQKESRTANTARAFSWNALSVQYPYYRPKFEGTLSVLLQTLYTVANSCL